MGHAEKLLTWKVKAHVETNKELYKFDSGLESNSFEEAVESLKEWWHAIQENLG